MVWTPPATVSVEQIRESSRGAEARAGEPIDVEQYLFTIESLGLPWDIGGAIYQPRGPVAVGPDGKAVGVFLIHGGGGDHRGFDTMARLLAQGKGYRVVTITYPGNLYLEGETYDWPGDTFGDDGSIRTPMWKKGEAVTPDQYDLVEIKGDDVFRAKYGTLMFLKAHPGSRFFDRLAAWPMAYEDAFVEACRRFLPAEDYSIYCSGVSTGGPFAHMILQRVENIVGLVGAESSPYGSIFSAMLDQGWPYDFDMMTVRTWRDVARYAGPEAGADAGRRLPWLMEEVFEKHRAMTHRPLLKAQHLVQFCATDALERAAEASAARLGLGEDATKELKTRFAGYPFPLGGDARPVPPLLYSIMANSRDHTFQRYDEILLPALARLDPAPKANIVRFDIGVHQYQAPLGDLPYGTAPAVADLWADAIDGGYYLP
ncbi:hypothetical protein [Jiangella mangrovi]|uniref:Pimeloyl-ACP methyl ester carboxylesterase n=1 Tax=Jiangella mangrovi TaxID=1524084 RepID=A0A7W9LM76_9ACTN|nr:hypothetical protein [Jiangella mangrovi]MBB5788832.1 pimeloyl-ACP methyl ester carboxylesterase [Jiangella mangrovi]